MATRAVTLRRGDARDIETLAVLIEGAFDPRYGEAWTRGQCLGVLAMPGMSLTLAEIDAGIDRRPVGFALIRAIADEAELLLLAVAPGRRRHGVGSALLRAAIGELAASGTVAFHLEVRAGNEAIHLYRAHGFAKVGERRGYYRGRAGEVHDAHTYRLALAS